MITRQSRHHSAGRPEARSLLPTPKALAPKVETMIIEGVEVETLTYVQLSPLAEYRRAQKWRAWLAWNAPKVSG